MSTAVSSSSTTSAAWRELYKAALFETDKREIAMRIAAAEKAIMQRARQLFSAGTDSEEDQALDDALYALHALQNCLGLETRTA